MLCLAGVSVIVHYRQQVEKMKGECKTANELVNFPLPTHSLVFLSTLLVDNFFLFYNYD